MEREIKVLLVDENRDALGWLSKQLSSDGVTVIGEAGFGPVAYTWASQLQPDVVLVGVEEPVARALKTVESLALGQPRWPVIVLSSKGDRDSIRKAMRAGADDYIAKPSSSKELRAAIASIVAREREKAATAAGSRTTGRAGTIVSVFGVKGGIGKTTLATNLAASAAMESKQRIALVDLDLQFGDVALMMDVVPAKTISDVVDAIDKLDADLIEGYLAKHNSGVAVLPAPLHIDGSDGVSGDRIQKLLEVLAAVYDYVILDTPNALNETVVAALDASTLVLLVTTPEIPCIKRTKACLDLMKHWQYSEDKVKLVVNKVNGRAEASPEDIESVLRYPAFWKLPFDHIADNLAGPGGLFVQAKPKSSISKGVVGLSRTLLGVEARKRGLMDNVKRKLAFSRR